MYSVVLCSVYSITHCGHLGKQRCLYPGSMVGDTVAFLPHILLKNGEYFGKDAGVLPVLARFPTVFLGCGAQWSHHGERLS